MCTYVRYDINYMIHLDLSITPLVWFSFYVLILNKRCAPEASKQGTCARAGKILISSGVVFAMYCS